MWRGLQLLMVPTLALSLLACERPSNRKEQAALAEHKILAQEFCAQSEPNADWSEEKLSAYQKKLDELETMETRIAAKFGNRTFFLCGRWSKAVIAQTRVQLASARATRILMAGKTEETLRDSSIRAQLASSLGESIRLEGKLDEVDLSSHPSDEALGLALEITESLIECYTKRIELLEDEGESFAEARKNAMESRAGKINLRSYLREAIDLRAQQRSQAAKDVQTGEPAAK